MWRVNLINKEQEIGLAAYRQGFKEQIDFGEIGRMRAWHGMTKQYFITYIR